MELHQACIRSIKRPAQSPVWMVGEETQTVLVHRSQPWRRQDAAIGFAGVGFRVYATGRTATTAEAFARVEHEAGGLDVLVNCAWGGYD